MAPADAGSRLDSWLARVAGLARGEAAGLIEAGLVLVDGSPARKADRVRPGQEVAVVRREAAPEPRAPAPFRIVYEDGDLAVVFKPAGVVTHPGANTRDETLAEALARVMPLAPAAGEGRAGIVHRLDRETSGLLVAAKTDAAYAALSAAMKSRQVSRAYIAAVMGTPQAATGRIEASLGRAPERRTRRAVVAGGRHAATEFRVLQTLDRCALCEVTLRTGRTHQIRVHFAHIGHPVVGDRAYGPGTMGLAAQAGLRRPFLHAYRLEFTHPASGEALVFTEPLPDDLRRALAALGGSPPDDLTGQG